MKMDLCNKVVSIALGCMDTPEESVETQSMY
jgi:hypothetical protein